MTQLQNLDKKFAFQRDIFSSNRLFYKRMTMNNDFSRFTKLNIVSKKKNNY